MQLPSLLFLLYFLPIAIVVYHALRFSIAAQNAWLLLASLCFYAWGNPVYALLLVLVTVLDYALALLADSVRTRGNKAAATLLFIATALVNVGPLLGFKYLPALAASLESATGWALTLNFPAAPLGLSFIALKGISYVADIWRQKAAVERNPVNCALYIAFFPTMFAGPIVRYAEVSVQIRERRSGWAGISAGVCRLIVGLAKVVLIAGQLSSLVDAVFYISNNSGTFTAVPVATAAIGLLAFVLYLYYCLSGLSDMVIGLGGIFGFTFGENFDYPLLATSVTDFWKRCYRSLTAWFEEYVGQSLSSKKPGRDHHVLSTFIMWLLLGFWIGPGISKLIFGIWSFVFIFFEQIIEIENSRISKGARHVYTAAAMVLGAGAIKTDSIYEFALFIANLFGANNNGFANAFSLVLLREFWLPLVLGLVFLFPVAPWLGRAFAKKKISQAMGAVLYTVGMLALAAVVLVVLVRIGHGADLDGEFLFWSKYYG